MKKVSKIISIALVLVLALSVMVLPSSAATPTIKADVVATYQGKTSGGYDYYKFSVYLDSTLSLCGYQLNITWDNAAWQMLRVSNLADQASIIANMCIDKNDTENIMYQASDAYAEYGGGNWDYGTANGYVLFPGDGTNPSLAKISNTNMGTTLTDAGYTGLYSAWANDFTDNYLCISGGTLNGNNSPTSGRVMVLSWYMRLKDGVEPGNYEVGFNAAQQFRLTGTYNTEDATGSLDVGTNKASIADSMVTYTNATVTVGAAGPALTHEGRQVKMTVADNAVVSGTEQLRVVSSISNDDWNNYFANTTDKDATTDKIVAVGFVAYKGQASTFNADTAKAVAQGTATDSNYSVATTDYIQNTGSGYRFGARVEYKTAVYDTTYLAFVQYKDASSNDAYVFYDTSTIYSLDFASNYDTITSDYIAFLNS
ncbi:MAG: hypothetical protein ACI4LB_02525 [Candidatus Fimenecus sp.]